MKRIWIDNIKVYIDRYPEYTFILYPYSMQVNYGLDPIATRGVCEHFRG